MRGGPRVFLSYTHEGAAHHAWVAGLCERLRAAGIDAFFDRQVEAGQSISHFMEKAITESDRVVMVLTQRYALKSRDRQGAVGIEQELIQGQVLAGAPKEKFIPILRSGSGEAGPDAAIPPSVQGVKFLDFRLDSDFEPRLAELVRALSRPPLGGSALALQAPAGEVGLPSRPSPGSMPKLAGRARFLIGFGAALGLVLILLVPRVVHRDEPREPQGETGGPGLPREDAKDGDAGRGQERRPPQGLEDDSRGTLDPSKRAAGTPPTGPDSAVAPRAASPPPPCELSPSKPQCRLFGGEIVAQLTSSEIGETPGWEIHFFRSTGEVAACAVLRAGTACSIPWRGASRTAVVSSFNPDRGEIRLMAP